MTSMPYRLSFTTGGLFLHEALALASCYRSLGDWSRVRAQARLDNLLQVRTAAAATRISKEVVARLELLDHEEVMALIELGFRDQAYLLWAAVCRRYAFLREFAIEVLREHYLLRRRELSLGDYDAFYNGKALWHAELDVLAVSTQKKLRQNLFRMLREARLLSDEHVIQGALPTAQLAQLLAQRSPSELLIFPASDADIQRWLA